MPYSRAETQRHHAAHMAFSLLIAPQRINDANTKTHDMTLSIVARSEVLWGAHGINWYATRD